MTHAAHTPQFHPHEQHSGQVRWASGLNFIAGIYLLISAWIGGTGAGNTWNSVIAGIVVAILAATRFSGSTGPWASWIDALIGIWLIISPWVYGYSGESWQWNSIVVGIIMVILGVWSALASNTSEGAAPTTTPRV
ncbi:MAG TPA: SPW repeat protein [Gemmatimonadaceae bacterium]|nr:SPW repeat protein [Gemmatimonadaceae bacterium]